MSLFKTSSKQKVKIFEIAAMMKKNRLSDKFIADAVEIALYYQGAYDLFQLWLDEVDQDEKDQIISDLQDEIDEYKEQPKNPTRKPYIESSHLELIGKDIAGFKAHLKTLVDQWGGISKLAKETGIPQPSLSRFFSSSSMPRRTTLYKIAATLNLSEKEIIIDWAA